jgi:putative transposase
VKRLCEVMRVNRSAYYNWLAIDHKPKLEDEVLKITVKKVFEKSRKTYGSRRLVKTLKEEGYEIGRFKVVRLMRELQLQARFPKRFKVTTDSNHLFNIAPNILNRHVAGCYGFVLQANCWLDC